MKGILFSNYFMVTYLLVLTCFSLVTSSVKQNREAIEKKDKSVDTHTTNVRVFVQLFFMIGLIIALFFLVFKYQIKPIIYFFYVAAVLIGIVVIPYSIWSFIQYVFIKPFDFELTKIRESALGLTGFILYGICGIIANGDSGNQINQLLLKIDPVIADLLTIALLTFWYFTVTFFTLSFFILTLHKINIFVRSRIKNKKPTVTSKRTSEKNGLILSKLILEKIDMCKDGKPWIKVKYYVFWVVCIPVDLLIGLLKVMYIDAVKLIFIASKRFLRNGVRFLVNILSKNQGKAIIIVSRVSLVGSLIFVYLIDKYQQIFSISGSEIYEFICSVIIIPLLITQLIEIRSKRKGV